MSQKEAQGIADNIVPNLMAIEFDAENAEEERTGLMRAAEVAGGRLAGRTDLRERFRRDEDEDLINRVGRFMDFAIVDDPVQSARDAMEDDDRVKASPVHKLGFHWHAAYSATSPEGVTGVEFADLPDGDRGRVIAVVDTGIVAPEVLPSWIGSSVINGAEDVEILAKGEVSHGTFVASLLRQVAPTHTISMAMAGGFEAGDALDPDHPKPDPTTEVHVAGAIDRLIRRHRGDMCTIEALNLSIGGPVVDDLEMVTVQRAIGRWREAFPKTPIFAAAGNSPKSEMIYPAAFRFVRGVAAADHHGEQVVWRKDSPDHPPTRPWVDDLAPGIDLIGLGTGSDEAFKWSGSSFAAAVATASHVNGGPVDVRGGIAYWPNKAMRYGDVPGLKYAHS